jgi:hypothetical protein
MCTTSSIETSGRSAGFLRAPEEGLAGTVERPAAALEDLGVAVGHGEELVGKRAACKAEDDSV